MQLCETKFGAQLDHGNRGGPEGLASAARSHSFWRGKETFLGSVGGNDGNVLVGSNGGRRWRKEEGASVRSLVPQARESLRALPESP